MTYIKRKLHAERAIKEASGENFWTDEFSESTRIKVLFAIHEYSSDRSEYILKARYTILSDLGMKSLTALRASDQDDFINYAKLCEDWEFPVVIEEILNAYLSEDLMEWLKIPNFQGYMKRIAEILLEDRINYDFIDGKIIPRETQVLHSNVILPTLRLLGSGEKWRQVETNYLKGLKEISANDPADAITDFGSALEDFLKAIGCSGGTLGKLITDGVNRSTITGRDRKLFDWVATERNAGEAHGGGGTESLSDAWLVANVIGSVILRWSSEPLNLS